MRHTRISEKVRQYYYLVDAMKIDELVDLFAPDTVYYRPGYLPIIGRPSLRKFYLEERIIKTGEHTIEELLADDQSAAVTGRFTGSITGDVSADIRFADFFRFDEFENIEMRKTFFFVAAV